MIFGASLSTITKKEKFPHSDSGVYLKKKKKDL